MEARDFYHIKGDAPDPAGTGLRGKSSTISLGKSAIGHPRILAYAGHEPRLITADVYKEPGADKLFVHLYCPFCENALRVHEDQKPLVYDPHTPSPLTKFLMEGGDRGHVCPCGCEKNYYGGLLFLGDTTRKENRIGCTWERDNASAVKRVGSPNVETCPWQGIVVARNVARR